MISTADSTSERRLASRGRFAKLSPAAYSHEVDYLADYIARTWPHEAVIDYVYEVQKESLSESEVYEFENDIKQLESFTGITVKDYCGLRVSITTYSAGVVVETESTTMLALKVGVSWYLYY